MLAVASRTGADYFSDMRLRIPRVRIGRVAQANVWCAALLLFFWVNSVVVAANQILLPRGSAWRFSATGDAPPADWAAPAFDDAAWTPGLAKIGIGHQDHTTLLPAPLTTPRMAVYFRRQFVLPASPAGCTGLIARMVCDAGAVLYLNGIEAGRIGMPPGPVTALTPASAEPFFPAEGALRRVVLDHSLLVSGANTLAVELHASSVFDFDLDFDLELIASHHATPSFVVRGPYLQNGAPTAVSIRWRTDVPVPTEACAGTSTVNLDVGASDPTPTTEHEIRLENLAPDTTYFYAVSDGVEWIEGPGAEWQFRTPPLPGVVKPVRVWVLGDSGKGRSGTGSAEAVRDGYWNSAFYQPPDVWLMLGDNAYGVGSDDEYQNAVFDTYGPTLRSSILWSTLGNHETYTPGVPYFSIFTLPTLGEGGGLASGTEHYYAFDYANIHFVCLDSMESSRLPASAMLSWLEADLAATSQPWIVAFFHHPPYTKGSHDSDFEIAHIEMRENVLPILEQYGVDLVLGGHSHAYERSFLLDGHYGYSWDLTPASIKDAGSGRADEPDGAYGKDPGPHRGAVYCVAGSAGQAGGGSLDHPVMYVEMSELGSLIFDVNGDRLDAKFINHQGIVRDYFTISKAPLVTISAPRPSLAEGLGGPGEVRLFRDREMGRAISVQLALAGTATPGADYGAPLLPAVIPAGVQTLDLPFSAFTDAIAEGTETISVTLLADSAYRLPKLIRSVTLSLADRPVDAWRFDKFGLQANDAAVAGDDADPDADGQSNLAEYLAGTEPRDGASTFAATPVRKPNGQFAVRFLARKGRAYTVLYRPAFTAGNWQTLANVVPPAASQIIEIPDPSAALFPQRFYKVITAGPP